MKNFFLNTFLIILCICLQGRCFSSNVFNFSGVDDHLRQYIEVNQNHHDNIDDRPHVHSHKHTNDGEEHEHHHEHNKVSYSEVKLANSSEYIIVSPFSDLSKNNFFERIHSSNSYPNRLFRPPIA